MVFPFKSRRKDSEKSLEPSISPIFEENLDEPQPSFAAIDLSLKEFAETHGLSESEVWRRIKRGELAGRPQDGELRIGAPSPTINASVGKRTRRQEESDETVRMGTARSERRSQHSHLTYEHADKPYEKSRPAPTTPGLAKKSTLPPVPPAEPSLESTLESTARDEERKGALSNWPTPTEGGDTSQPSTELALLIDHLSLSKDENREILRLAQESIRKITELSDTLVAMKDAVIEAKSTQIDSLKGLLALRDKEIKTLQKSNEDLEILARTVSRQVILEQDS
jgi:hypothetical protein